MTVSTAYGSGGREVALLAATALHFRFLDTELLARVAQEAGVPLSEVARLDEQAEHPLMRALRRFLVPTFPYDLDDWGAMVPGYAAPWESGLRSWREGTPALDEDDYVKLTQKVFLRTAAQGGAVIVGRGAQGYLANYPGVVHVRITAPEAHRVARVVRRDGLDAPSARRLIRSKDAHALRFHRRHYGLDWRGADLYHLVLNVATMGLGAAARTLVAAVHQDAPLPEPVSV